MSQERDRRRKRAIIIGAGFGGLGAAIRLQAAGVDVTLLEATDQPGGRAGRIEAAGYSFDAGPTIVTAPQLLEELFCLGGVSVRDRVRLAPLEPFYQVRFADGSAIDYGTAGPALSQQLEAFEPGAAAALDRFLAHTRRLYHRAFEELGLQDFSSIWNFLRVVPDLVTLRADRSVYALVSRYFRDPRLRILFSFHPLFIGGNPVRASSVYAIVPYLEQIDGVHYVLGGTHALVRALVGLFQELGGRVAYSVPATQILVEEAIPRTGSAPGHTPGWLQRGARGRVTGVRTADGQRWPADVVVSNADVLSTYRRLLPARWRRRWTDARLDRLKLSMSCFLLYLGLNRPYPQLRHHTIVMPADYPAVLVDLFERRVLPREQALYLHAPTRTDPSLAPPGGEVLYVLAPVPHLDGRVDWEVEAPRMRERILSYLEHDLGLDGLRQAIVVERRRTPVDFRDLLGSEHGAAFSIQPLLFQSAYFRPHNRSEDVDGLYLAGAGTHPGAGIPGVLLAAKIAATLALRDLATK